MSADDYMLIVRNGDGFSALRGFASNDHGPVLSDRHKKFDTLAEAHAFAISEAPEYGVAISRDILAGVK